MVEQWPEAGRTPTFPGAGEPDAAHPTGQYDAFIPLERGMVAVMLMPAGRLRRAHPGRAARYGGGRVAQGRNKRRGEKHKG